jgi:hypothetical protein
MSSAPAPLSSPPDALLWPAASALARLRAGLLSFPPRAHLSQHLACPHSHLWVPSASPFSSGLSPPCTAVRQPALALARLPYALSPRASRPIVLVRRRHIRFSPCLFPHLLSPPSRAHPSLQGSPIRLAGPPCSSRVPSGYPTSSGVGASVTSARCALSGPSPYLKLFRRHFSAFQGGASFPCTSAPRQDSPLLRAGPPVSPRPRVPCLRFRPRRQWYLSLTTSTSRLLSLLIAALSSRLQAAHLYSSACPAAVSPRIPPFPPLRFCASWRQQLQLPQL